MFLYHWIALLKLYHSSFALKWIQWNPHPQNVQNDVRRTSTNGNDFCWKMRLESKLKPVSRYCGHGTLEKCRDRCCGSIYVFVARETSRKRRREWSSKPQHTLCPTTGKSVVSAHKQGNSKRPATRERPLTAPVAPLCQSEPSTRATRTCPSRALSRPSLISPRAVSPSAVPCPSSKWTVSIWRRIWTESDGFAACGYVGRQVSSNFSSFQRKWIRFYK